VVRDCAHLKKVGTCLDCELDSCYHFEAYTARRRLMRERTQRLTAKLGRSKGAIRGGCGCGSGGGCGSGNGGCSGCSLAGGCSASKVAGGWGSIAYRGSPSRTMRGGFVYLVEEWFYGAIPWIGRSRTVRTKGQRFSWWATFLVATLIMSAWSL